MAKGVTLTDIAERVWVSNVAVHKALTDKPGVNAELRSKIKALAKEMGYTGTASAAGKTKAGEKTGNIGVVIPEQYYGLTSSFYGRLYEEVVKTLYRNGHFGIMELLSTQDENSVTMPRVMQEQKVDGVIFLGPADRRYIEAMASQMQFPVLFLDNYIPTVTSDTVISDGYYGAYVMTDYLVGQGHRRIGFVGDVDASSSIADRYWGYRKALRDRGIVFEETWEIVDRNKQDGVFKTIVEDNDGMDAYVCNCDFIADIVIQNLEAKGYRVPEDVSVVGIDDFLPAGIDNTRITTYKVDIERMAEACVESLLKKINGEKYVKGIQVISGEIVCKRSVARRM